MVLVNACIRVLRKAAVYLLKPQTFIGTRLLNHLQAISLCPVYCSNLILGYKLRSCLSFNLIAQTYLALGHLILLSQANVFIDFKL